MPLMVHEPSELLLPNRVPDTETPGPLYANGIASAPAVPTNAMAQASTAIASTCVFMGASSAGRGKTPTLPEFCPSLEAFNTTVTIAWRMLRQNCPAGVASTPAEP